MWGFLHISTSISDNVHLVDKAVKQLLLLDVQVPLVKIEELNPKTFPYSCVHLHFLSLNTLDEIFKLQIGPKYYI